MTNEEKYKTSEERINAFDAFCGQYSTCRDCHIQGDRVVECVLNWLALEAEEDKPMPCKCCGGEAVVVQPWTADGASVMCKKCGVFIWAHTKADAISMWNGRTK